MSVFGGSDDSGGGKNYKPVSNKKIGKPPKRNKNKKVVKPMMRQFKQLSKLDSTAAYILGGPAAPPTRSYAMQLFNQSGSGGTAGF